MLKGYCWFCCGSYRIRKDGTLSKHMTTKGSDWNLREEACEGTGTKPADRLKGDPKPTK